MTPHPIRGGIIVCAAAIALLATGCHVSQPGSPTPSSDPAQAADQLKSLPSLEDTKTQVQNAMNQVTTAALRVIPSLVWLPVHGETPNGCGAPYDRSDGQSLFLPDLEAAGAQVSEPDWQTILAAARDAAATIGATDTQVMQDGPGNHDVGFYGPTGTFIKIGYQGNLVVSGSTGCRLPQDKK
jgi:Lipoprotein confined to pathogenic Mycobacterium